MFSKIQNKELDLLAAYNRKDGPTKSSKIIKMLAVPIGLLVIFGLSFLYLFMINHNLENKINEVKLSNEEIQLKIDVTDKEPYFELNTLKGTFDSLQQIDNYVSNLPEITKNKILNLQKSLLSGMSINSIAYNQQTKQMTVSYTSSNVQNIEKYITALKNTNQYSDISYVGYQQGSSTSTQTTGETDPLTGEPVTTNTVNVFYNFNLVMTLDGGAD